jgi:hypothetical protein
MAKRLKNYSDNLCFVLRSWQVAMFAILIIPLALKLIVAVENWQLYSRLEPVETILGLRAKPQFQQNP